MSTTLKSNPLLDYCKKNQIRVTSQRLEIYEEITKLKGHPNVDDIFKKIKKRMPYISMDTVYRNLNFFEKIGILSKVKNNQPVSRFETNTKPHHHFCCKNCNQLFDLNWEEFDHLKNPHKVGKIGEVTDRSVILYGICKNCSS